MFKAVKNASKNKVQHMKKAEKLYLLGISERP